MPNGFGNLILDSLPPGEAEELRPLLQLRRVEVYELLHDQHQPIEYVYFPKSALLSSTTVVEEGTIVEAITVGREGMVGLPVALGVHVASMREMGEIAGEAYQAPAMAFAKVLAGAPALHRALLLYTDAVLKLLAQTAACNRLHPAEARCARWLLMTHDRVGAPVMGLTHQVMSDMLGTNRPTVTLALHQLRATGAIRLGRGEVEIIDRALVLGLACECYAEIRQRFDLLYERLSPEK